MHDVYRPDFAMLHDPFALAASVMQLILTALHTAAIMQGLNQKRSKASQIPATLQWMSVHHTLRLITIPSWLNPHSWL